MTNILLTINSPELNQAIMSLAAAINPKNNGSKIMPEDGLPFEMIAGAWKEPETTFMPTYQKDQNMRDCSIEQLIMETIGLIDAGYRTELSDLLADLGVSSLVWLPKEKYGTYAARLQEWRRS